MSRNLAGLVSIQNYIGQPYFAPSQLLAPRKENPRAVPLTVDWSAYGASSLNQRVAVAFNFLLGGSGGSALLDSIRAVYIDNTFSDVAVYVYFEDSKTTVVCPPNAVVMSPVSTNLKQGILYAEGFETGNIPITSFQFFNIEQAGYYIPASFEIVPVLTYLATTTLFTRVGNTITFANVPVGAYTSNRLSIFAISVQNGLPAVSVTINGVAASTILSVTNNNNPTLLAWGRVASPLTTATIAVTYGNNNQLAAWCASYKLVNQSYDVPTDFGNTSDGVDNTKTLTLAFPGGSAFVGIGGGSSGTGVWARASADLIVTAPIFVSSAQYQTKNAQTRAISLSLVRSLVGAVWE